MNYTLPYFVEIDGKRHKIRNKCDYRVILDCINALNDLDLEEKDRFWCALFIFYEDIEKIDNFDEAIKQMNFVINCGEEKKNDENRPVVMDWDHDFDLIASAVSRVLGYDIRTPRKFTHWWTFISAYMEIGDCAFTTIVNIRTKRIKGEKLEKWESDFFNENREKVLIPRKMSREDQAFFDDDL